MMSQQQDMIHALGKNAKIINQETRFTAAEIKKALKSMDLLFSLDSLTPEQAHQVGKNILGGKIKRQLILSLTTLMLELRKKQNSREGLKIHASQNQLSISCKIPEFDGSIFFKPNVFQIATLRETIYSRFEELGTYTPEQIVSKIEQMFTNLYKALQFLFLTPVDEPTRDGLIELDEFDFLIYPEAKVRSIYKYKKEIFNRKVGHEPILIGGLVSASYKFMRNIFLCLLSYYKESLVPYLKERELSYVRDKKFFIEKYTEYIEIKIQAIEDYEKDTVQTIGNEIQRQMQGFRYQKVFDAFMSQVPEITNQYYSSIASIFQYNWYEAFHRSNGNGTIAISEFIEPGKLDVRRVSKQGVFQSNEPQINLQVLLNNLSFRNVFKIQESDIKLLQYKIFEYQVLHHTFNRNRQGIFINSQGSYFITALKQADCEKGLKQIKKILNLEPYQQFDTYLMKGNLGLGSNMTIPLLQLQKIPYFANRLEYKIPQRQIERRKQLAILRAKQRKAIDLRIQLSRLIEPIKPQFQPPIQQNLATTTRVAELTRNQQLNEYKQNSQPYVIYEFQYNVNPTATNLERQKQIMKFYITKEGHVKVQNIVKKRNQQIAKQQFQRLKKIIKEKITKVDDQFVRRARQRDELAEDQSKYINMNITAYPKRNSLECHQRYQGEKMYFISQRPTMTYRNGEQVYENQLSHQFCLNKLKILTWNIWGFRIEEDYKFNENERIQVQKMEKKRLQSMLTKIIQLEPDIICLQEAFILFKKNKGENRTLAEQFIKKLSSTYYFAQYNPKDLKFEQQNHDENEQNPKDEQRRNDRTVIFSKFPMKFYNTVFKIGDKSKAMVLGQLSMTMNVYERLQVNKNVEGLGRDRQTHRMGMSSEKVDVKILVGSVHMKAGQNNGDDEFRNFQLSKIQSLRVSKNEQFNVEKVRRNFNMCILAGDFNSYDIPGIPQTELSPIGKSIRQKFKYRDAQDSMTNHEHTYMKGDKQPKVLDKVIFKFDNQLLNERFKIIQSKPIGFESMEDFKAEGPNRAYFDQKIRTPSDHIGRYVEMAFLK